MIKTLICDLGGVYFTDGSARAIERISATYEVATDQVSDVLMGELGSRYRCGEIKAAQFWDRAKQNWDLQVPTDEIANNCNMGDVPLRDCMRRVGVHDEL